jgi:hypothetical protein
VLHHRWGRQLPCQRHVGEVSSGPTAVKPGASGRSHAQVRVVRGLREWHVGDGRDNAPVGLIHILVHCSAAYIWLTFAPTENWRNIMFYSTIDDIITRLQKAYIPGNWETVRRVLITDREIAEWGEKTGLRRSDLYDALALRLALGFHNDSFDFGFCDRVVNDLHAVMSVQNEDRPELFWNVFLAFDAGRFYPNGDRSIDRVEALTRPQIAQIIRLRVVGVEQALDCRVAEDIEPLIVTLANELVELIRRPTFAAHRALRARHRRLDRGPTLNCLVNDAIALSQFQQLIELLLAYVGVDGEAQTYAGETDRHVLGDPEGAAKIEVAFGRHGCVPQWDVKCGRDGFEGHTRTCDQRLKQHIAGA